MSPSRALRLVPALLLAGVLPLLARAQPYSEPHRPQFHYLLLDEDRIAESDLSGMKKLAAETRPKMTWA